MSLRAEPIGPVPEETARVARAAFPKGHLCWPFSPSGAIVWQRVPGSSYRWAKRPAQGQPRAQVRLGNGAAQPGDRRAVLDEHQPGQVGHAVAPGQGGLVARVDLGDQRGAGVRGRQAPEREVEPVAGREGRARKTSRTGTPAPSTRPMLRSPVWIGAASAMDPPPVDVSDASFVREREHGLARRGAPGHTPRSPAIRSSMFLATAGSVWPTPTGRPAGCRTPARPTAPLPPCPPPRPANGPTGRPRSG